MSDANIRINVETASLEQLNSELGRLQAQISKVAVGSAEFKRLSAEIRRIDGAVEGANKKLKALDVGAVAGDVAKLGGAVASSAALFKQFGEEGSSSQEAIQSALETTNTILGAGAIAEGVASAARLASTTATNAAAAAQAAYATVVGTSTGALKAFRIALAATGIGLAVVALGALVANWDKLVEAISGSTKSAKEFKTENDKILAQIEKEQILIGLRIETQKANGEAEKELLRQRVEGITNAEAKIDKLLQESAERRGKAQSDYENNRSESNKKILDEEIKINEELLLEALKLGKDRAQLERDSLNLRLKTLNTERERAVFEARKRGQETFTAEKEFEVKKLQALKASGIATKEEIEAQQFEIDKIEEEARQERLKKSQEAAQKRQERLKKDFEDVITILKDQDIGVALEAIDADQKEVQASLDRVKASLDRASKSSKDFTAILKQLKKDGLEPYAEFLKIVVKDGDIDQIGEAIDKAFNERRLQSVKGFLSQFDSTIISSIEELQGKIDVALEAATKDGNQVFSAPFKFKKDLKSAEGELIKFSRSPGVSGIGPAAEIILDRFDQITEGLKKSKEQQFNAIEALLINEKITLEEANKLVEEVIKKFDKTAAVTAQKRAATLKQIVDGQLKIIEKATQEGVTKLNQDIAELELDFANDTYNKTGFAKIKAEEKFAKERLSLTQQSIRAQITGYDNELAKLKEQKSRGLLTEEEYAERVKEINTKKKDATIALEKSTTDAVVSEFQKRQDKVQAFFDEVRKYYDTIAQSIQALGNIIADQAAIDDLRYTEELEKIQGIYDARFKLIDEEEQKLDELEQAKETNLTRTERKRIQLSKERAALEAEQEQALAQIEAERANAAADAAIKQANVNFALAVGQITVATAEAIAKSVAASPTTFGAPFSVFAAAQGAIQLAAAGSARSAAISQAEASRPGVSGAANVGKRVSKATGGLIEGPGNGISDSVPANLSTGEFVINANSTRKFLPLLNQINQAGLQGGNPVNPGMGSDTQMVSLLQEIKSQLAQPNRSYVLLNDIENIQNKQTYINRRSNVL